MKNHQVTGLFAVTWLLKTQWWDWPYDKIRQALPCIMAGEAEELPLTP